MGYRSLSRVGFALVFLVFLHSVSAIDKCKTGCSAAPGVLKLTPGTTYKYDYNGKISITLSSAEGQKTTTDVKANVFLTQQPDCSQVLRLANVQIIGPDGKKRVGIPGIEKPVVLNNNNGNLNEIICTERGENEDSLNVKRAIASFFQAGEDKNTEIDIFGQCPTSTSKTINGDITTIVKTKNLDKCAFRQTTTHNYITSTLNFNSGIQSSPVLSSKLDSRQKIKAGVLETANTVENYLFIPFSVGHNGAKATVESSLKLTGTATENPTTKCQTPSSIIFENPHPVNSPKTTVNVLLKKVKEIAENLGTNVVDQTGIQFIDLVKLIRVSKKADTLSVYNQVKSGVGFSDKVAAKKILLDAVMFAASGDAIEVAIELLKSKELDPIEEKILYAGLGRSRYVAEGAIKAATELLNKANLPREAYLGIGSLAGRYCAIHNCQNVPVIDKIIQKLLSKLGDLKAANRKEESDMIYVLKGLTNIGHLSDAVLTKLVSLAEDKNQPARLRVATIDAFQADPCKDKLRNSALKILKDLNEDSEIRIEAYLVLARCPNDKIGNAVRDLLNNEPSEQVGGFISTHIRNTRSSANPDKERAKAHLGFVSTPSKYQFDPRKYSYNAELSHSIDTLGLGGSAESNVIYSQNSWLPRSTSLNLTAEIFGQRLNFLEVAIRQENLDRVIEHYLGPQGVLKKATLQKTWDETKKPVEKIWNDLKEKVGKSLRSRRDVSKADIDAINAKVQLKANDLDKNLDLDLSIKNFGSEIIFMNSFDSTENLSPQSIIDSLIDKLNEGIDKLKNFQKVLRSNLIIIDSELSYPTSLGFPLRLGLDGASNIQVKAEGNLDVRDLINRKKQDIDLKISLIPSATVTISGRLSLDTPLVENGLKVTSSLHTSTGGELSIKTFKDGAGVDIQYKIPVKNQELIDLKHDIIFQTRENGAPVQTKKLKFNQNKDFSLCIDQLTDIIGLEFCAEVNGPNLQGKKIPILPFPLSGDAKASVKIERGEIDTFHYRREFFPGHDGKIGAEATFEASGGNKKGIGLSIGGFISPTKYIKATLTSPIKNAEAEARLICDDKEKLLSLELKDGDKVYTGKAGLRVSGGTDKTVYDPVLEYTTPENKAPQKPPLHIEGRVIAEKKGDDTKYTLDGIKAVIPGQNPVTLVGNFGSEGKAHFADLTASDGKSTGSIKGRVECNDNSLKIQTEVRNPLLPSANFKLDGEFQKKGIELISSNIQLTHGADLNSKTNVITLANSLVINNLKSLEILTKNKFSYPLFSISGQLDFQRTPKNLDYDALIQYKNVKYGSELQLNKNMKSVGDYALTLKAFDSDTTFIIKSSRIGIGADDSKIDNSFAVNDDSVEISGKLKHHIKPRDIVVGADLVLRVSTTKNPLKLSSSLKVNPREIDGFVKVSAATNPIIDILLKANKGGNVNGHAKVKLIDFLGIEGKIKATKGAGNADILVNVVSLKRIMKADATFTIRNPLYNIDLTVYPNKDNKNNKITFSTKNKVNGVNLDTSNSLNIILGSKYSVNLKAQTGNPANGKTVINSDLTLPGQYFSLDITRQVSSKDGKWNANNLVVLLHGPKKGTNSRELTLTAVSRDTNLRAGIADLDLKVNIENLLVSRKTNFELSAKRSKENDKWTTNLAEKLTGTWLKNPVEASILAQRGDSDGHFVFKASVSPKANVEVEANMKQGGPTVPFSEDIKATLALPVEILSKIHLTHGLTILAPTTSKPGLFELSGSLETDSSKSLLNINTEGSVQIKGDRTSGNSKYHGSIVKPVKVSLDISRSHSVDVDKKTGNLKSDFKLSIPENRVIEGSVAVSKKSQTEYELDAALNLPTQVFKSNKISVRHKHEKDNIKCNSELTIDGKKHSLDTTLSSKEKEPSVDIKLTHPDGKIEQLVASIKAPSDNKFTANAKVISQPHDFLAEGGLDVNSESLNNFDLKLTANVPKINVKNVIVTIGNAGSNDGKTLKISIDSNGKNVVTGSATVSAREELGKVIIEGSGNFKIKNAAKSGNFKYIRTSLTSEKNGEVGEEISIDATLGNEAIDAELKITNKEFRYLNSYCEESKQCAHVELVVKNSVEDATHFQNQVEVTIDLRVLGIPNEFGLKSVTKRQDWTLDHTVDIHFENAANKYQYSSYIHPKQAGISLTTPKRIIALEANLDIPKIDINKGGKASGEIALYTDKKNNPSSKTSLKGVVNVANQGRSVQGELTLNAIGQQKPMTIKYKRSITTTDNTANVFRELVIDIFPRDDQKITAAHEAKADLSKQQAEDVVTVKSQGLGINLVGNRKLVVKPKEYTGSYQQTATLTLGQKKYDSTIKLEISPKRSEILIKRLNNVFLNAKTKVDVTKNEIKLTTDASGVGWKPTVSTLTIKKYHTLEFIHALKNEPNNRLIITTSAVNGEVIDTTVEYQDGGPKKELANFSLGLKGSNFLKPEIKVQNDNLKDYQSAIEKIAKEEVQDASKAVTATNKAVSEELKKIAGNAKEAVPDLRNTKEFYTSELTKLRDELKNDKTLKELAEIIGTLVTTTASVASTIITTTADVVATIVSTATSVATTVLDTITKTIIPAVTDVIETTAGAVTSVARTILEVLSPLIAKISEIINSLPPVVEGLRAKLAEISIAIQKSLLNTGRAIETAINELIENIEAQLKASPLLEDLKKKYAEYVKNNLPTRDSLLNTVRTGAGFLKELVILPDIQNVIDLVEEYLEKKIKSEAIDDLGHLQKIGRAITGAAAKVVLDLTQELFPEGVRKLEAPSINWDILRRLPSPTGSLKISVINHLLKEDIGSYLKFLLRSILVPRDWIIPTPILGQVSSTEVFTFDGKVYHFPGNCNYLLSRDAVNGNFTIVASYKNGKLTGVTLSDNTGSLTVEQDKILLNHVDGDYPIHEGTLHAYRTYGFTEILSEAGVDIKCDFDMTGCAFKISGFYRGQLRGILGNANNEKFDDVLLPNKQLAVNPTELPAGYLVGSSGSCAPGQIDDGPSKPTPECDEAFGWNSPLGLCYPIVDRTNYKLACQYAAAAGNKDADKIYALHYAYVCWTNNIPIFKSPANGQCENSVTPRKSDDQFDVKLPGKSADVVVMVSTTKDNEELYKNYVQPLLGEIAKEFKTKGITDVQMHIVAYGGENLKPTHVTVNGKMTFTGAGPNLKFKENPKSAKLVTGCPDVDKVIDFVRVVLQHVTQFLGAALRTQTLTDVLQFPFRAEAVRSLIIVDSEACDSSNLVARVVNMALLSTRKDINLNVITPAKDLKVKDSKTTKETIGFNGESVLTLSEAPAKPSGNSALQKELSYKDECIDRAVSAGGNVFVSQNLGTNKPLALQIIAKSIVNQATSKQVELDCNCGYTLYNPFVPYNRCSVVSVAEK